MNKNKTILPILGLVFLLPLVTPVLAGTGSGINTGFVHGIVIPIDGVEYYLAGAPDGSDGAIDVPGHYWVLVGSNKLVGKHYNTGPFGASQWWSSDAPDGELLFIVKAIIDEWSLETAETMAAKGYVHYHELITVSEGTPHPTKVVWLKHTARTSFSFDRGPHPEFGYEVSPGINYEFMPNWKKPYFP